MSEESGGKKPSGGHFAVALAGLGALFARTADDCGRVAIKSASLGDDALRGASRVGSLADDGLRSGSKLGSLADDGLRTGSKFGSLADDGMHAGKVGALADEGLHGGSRFSPHGEGPAGLVEEMGAGAKTESHAGDIAENAVDVSIEVISNAPTSDDSDDSAIAPDDATIAPKFDGLALLRARTTLSQPAFLPVLPVTSKAYRLILGRPEKPDETRAFVSVRPTPDDGQPILDPVKWLKGRLSHNPITFVFYTTDESSKQDVIPLVLPNGELTNDETLQRACIEHYSHCIILACKPEKSGYKEPCVQSVATMWQSVTAKNTDLSLQNFLEKIVRLRQTNPALQGLALSRVDVSQNTPRIVRSRIATKTK